MTDLEIQEQAERMYPVKLIVIDASLTVDSNKLSREAFIAGAKWLQEQEEWIDLPAKEMLPSGYYAIRISHNGFVDVKFEFIDNQIIPYYYATHYYPVTLPSPPKTK